MSQTDPSDPQQQIRRRNLRVAAGASAVFVGMLAMAFAAVPLYRMFCELTGFDGSPRRASAASEHVLDKTLEVRFDANVRNLPWTFKALQSNQTIRIGETGLAFFRVTNNGPEPVTGHAVFNVSPSQAGPYFQKLQCFCFSDQTIAPGKTIDFPVLYFVDPKYADDFETRGEPVVTLSYTFFRAVEAKGGEKRAEAMQAGPVSALGGTQRAGL